MINNQEAYFAWLENERLPFYEKNASLNRILHLFTQTLILTLAAITPVFAALTGYASYAVASGATLAILEGVTRVFRFKEIWVTHRYTKEMLKREIRMFQSYQNPYTESDKRFSIFVSEIEKAMESEINGWLRSSHQSETNKENTATD